jgi:hypothetical protein
MFQKKLAHLKQTLWQKFLPHFISHGVQSDEPYNYYSVFFKDVDHKRYHLVDYTSDGIEVELWDSDRHEYRQISVIPVSHIDEMQVDIIHFLRNGQIHFNSIFSFTFNYYTRLSYLKNIISRGKGRLVSTFFSNKEFKSRDRIALLNLLVNEYIQQRPSKLNIGASANEVIELLYGKLWYKHIHNEEFLRKITLLLQSLVITDDLVVRDDRYFVQGKAIATIVEHEKDERRSNQQLKMQKNQVRLMLIITASTLMITLALLSLAGVVDLHKIWQYITQLKPIRIILKLI